MAVINPVPAFSVTLNGKDLTGKIRPRLIGLTLSEKRGADSDQLDITIDDSDGRMAIPKAGALIALKLGWKAGSGVILGMVDKGTYQVDEIEHSGAPDHLILRARAVNFTDGARVRKLKSWHDTTLGAVITELAGNNGLTAKVADALAGKTIAILAQGRLSDMALIRQLGKKYDAVATVKAGNLLFAPIGKGTTATGKAIPAATITRNMGDGHSYKRAARDQYSGATAYWHDPHSATLKGVHAGSTTKGKRLRKTYGSEADARDAAEAEHSRDQRGAASMSFNLALGRPDLYPERHLTVSGFKPEIDKQKWLIIEATHTLSDQGFTTSLSLEVAI